MLGQEPRLPVDFLLGRVEEPTVGSICEWVQEHQTRLRLAFEGVRERFQVAANSRKARHDAHVHDLPLADGQRVCLRNMNVRGRHKIQDLWSPVTYVVLKAPPEGGSVYTIGSAEDLQQVKQVHWTLLKAWVEGEPQADMGPIRPQVPAAPHPDSGSEGDDLVVVVPGPSQVPGQLGVGGIPTAVAAGPESCVPTVLAEDTPADLGEAEYPDSPSSGTLSQSAGQEVQRRTARVGAGQHSNLHRLPQPIEEVSQTLPHSATGSQPTED